VEIEVDAGAAAAEAQVPEVESPEPGIAESRNVEIEVDAGAAAAEAQVPEVESPESLPSVLGYRYPALCTQTDGQADDSPIAAQEGSLPREGQPTCGRGF